jgi:amino acid adenylation domain-containing protein
VSALSATELLSKLRSLNVTFAAEGERLRLNAPGGVITPDLREELNSHKAEILSILQDETSAAKLGTHITPRIPSDKELPLSFAQQRLWFLAQMEGVSEAYHISRGLRLKGKLDHIALRRALDRILARHEALRTSFAEVAGEPVQRISAVESCRFPLVEHDLRLNANATAEVERLAELEVCTPFDLVTGPLIRGRLIQLSEDEHVLLIVMHHIVSDAWSVSLLFKEISALYSAFLNGESDPLPKFEVQYPDYSAWQRQWLSGDDLQSQASYWKSVLAGAPSTLELPTDHPRPAVQDHRGAFEQLVFDERLKSELREFSRRHRITPFMTLMAAWAVMLTRISGQQDVLIGMPAANRGQKEIEELIGFFVNTLVVRLDLSGSPSVRELLERVKLRTLAALQHQDIPFERVVALVHPTRSLAQSPLFQVMFAWQSADEIFELPAIKTETLHLPRRSAIFDLTLYLQEEGSTIYGGLEYATSLFAQPTIQRYVGYFRSLLQAMIADDSELIDRLPMLSECEQRHLLVDWNRTERDYSGETPLAAQIEDQVSRTPDAIAVVFEGESLTYRDLNARANQLARELVKHGAGPDELVGIFVDRSLEMMITLLAIAKAGAGYVPMDPYLPAARLQFMIEESGMRIVVTQKNLLPELPEFQGHVATLEDDEWRKNSSENLNVEVRPDCIAYVIYTSGSTGKPKGVEIPYRSLLNLLWSVQDWLKFSASDRLLAVTTISFDIASADIWLPWLVGATTILSSREAAADGAQLRTLMEHHHVTFLQATPITWWLLLGAGWRGRPDLQIVCTGEAMPRELAAKLVPLVGRLWNLYGPTETTIWSTGYLVQGSEPSVLIGRPVANTQCYILNEQRQLSPTGSVGELYIAGDGLARGYLKRPDLTEEKFVPNPFSMKLGARMYRTGDLARYLPDGNIECLGRSDHQVKIRGYRIELDEVQLALSRLPKIGKCVVVVREKDPGDPHLAAYYTLSEITKPTVPELRAALREVLPNYMVPDYYVELEELPLTYNGKIDRKALPDPFTSAVDNSVQVSAELAAVELLLGQHPEIAAVALVQSPVSSPDARPVAFAVPNGSEEPPAIVLRKHLRGRCPEKAIPEKIVYLKDLPLNGQGEIDRARLVTMAWGADVSTGTTGSPSDAPQTEAEVILAKIWRELLKVSHIGTTDKFFDLGGQSLLSIQMIARVEKETGYRFNLRNVLVDSLGQLANRMTEGIIKESVK